MDAGVTGAKAPVGSSSLRYFGRLGGMAAPVALMVEMAQLLQNSITPGRYATWADPSEAARARIQIKAPPVVADAPLEWTSPRVQTPVRNLHAQVRQTPSEIEVDFFAPAPLPPPSARRRLAPHEVRFGVGIPAEFPQYVGVPARLLVPDEKPDVLVPPLLPPVRVLPSRHAPGLSDLPRTEFRIITGTRQRPRLALQRITRPPPPRGPSEENRLRKDRKTQSALRYASMVRATTKALRSVTEILDYTTAFRHNLILREPLELWVDSVRDAGMRYRVTIEQPQALGSLPLNAQREVLSRISEGSYDGYALDIEGMAQAVYAMELMDYVAAGTMRIETDILNTAGRHGPLQYGNVTTWFNRARRLVDGLSSP